MPTLHCQAPEPAGFECPNQPMFIIRKLNVALCQPHFTLYFTSPEQEVEVILLPPSEENPGA